MKAITPRKIPFGKREANKAVRGGLEDGGELTIELLERTWRTWNSQPKAVAVVKGRGGDYVLSVQLTPADLALRWRFLDGGTSVRYAIMSDDFVPKTTPKLLSSKAGKGGVVAFTPHNAPRPGIEARGWSELIAKRVDADLPKFMRARLREADGD